MTPSVTLSVTRWHLVFIATIAGFAAAFNVGKVAPTLLLIRDELQTGLFEMGLVVSSFSILTMILAIPMGLLAARIGAYRIALTALTLLAIGALITSQSAGLGALLSGRVLEGLGYVMIVVSAPALIAASVSHKDRPIAMAIWSTWLPVGISLMFIISPFIIAASGWRNVWLVTAVFALCWLMVVAWSFRSHTAQQTTAPKYESGDWKVLLQRGPLLTAAAFACFSSLFIVTTSFLPTAWQQSKGIPIQSTSAMFALAIASHALGNLFGGWLVAKGFRMSRVMLAGFVIPACLVGLTFREGIAYEIQYVLALAYLFIVGVIPGSVFATMPAYANSPRQISLLMGLIFQGAATGQVMGPILFSRLIEYAGGDWNQAIWYFLSFALLGGLIMWMIPEPDSQTEFKPNS